MQTTTFDKKVPYYFRFIAELVTTKLGRTHTIPLPLNKGGFSSSRISCFSKCLLYPVNSL